MSLEHTLPIEIWHTISTFVDDFGSVALKLSTRILHSIIPARKSPTDLLTQFIRADMSMDRLISLRYSGIEVAEAIIKCGRALGRQPLEYLLTSGSLAFLKYLHEHRKITFTLGLAVEMASSGHLECVKYIYETGYKLHASQMVSAAQGGYQATAEQLMIAAAAGGHLPVIQYLHSQGALWIYKVTQEAFYSDSIECFDWAKQHGCQAYDYSWQAAKAGKLIWLVYFATSGQLDYKCVMAAAAGGHLDCLEFLLQFGSKPSAAALEAAAAAGQLDSMILLRKHGACWYDLKYKSESVCTAAAAGGHLDCLKWAQSHGARWSYKTYFMAQKPCADYMLKRGFVPRRK